MRQVSETILSETRGGGHTQRKWWHRKISLRCFDRHIARCWHPPPAVDRWCNQLGYSTDRGCGLQVIETTASWMLSRVGPILRQGQYIRILLYDWGRRSSEGRRRSTCPRETKTRRKRHFTLPSAPYKYPDSSRGPCKTDIDDWLRIFHIVDEI